MTIPRWAVYLRAPVLSGWENGALDAQLDRFAKLGVDGVVTKADLFTSRLAEKCRTRGLAAVASFPCYLPPPAGEPVPKDVATNVHGLPLPGEEWYTGLIPTDREFNDVLVRRCEHACASGNIDGIVFDFLRWPMHWELRLRPGADKPMTSFDPTTLAEFSKYVGGPVTIGEVTGTPALLEQWTQFRCSVIETMAARLAAIAKANSLWSGMFIVPGSEVERRELLGQYVAALGRLVDLLVPMTYYSILHRQPAWVSEVVAQIRQRTTTKIIPLLQITAAPEFSTGWDWGPNVSAEDLAIIRRSLLADDNASTSWIFPGEALDEVSPMWPGIGKGTSS